MRLHISTMLALMAVACGGRSTPSAPSAPAIPQLAGVWSGTFESTNFNQQAITLQLTQAGGSVNGTWGVVSLNWTGTIAGTVDTVNFSGSITFNGPSASGGTCTGTASMSGTPGVSTMTWTSVGVTGNCTGLPAGIRWVLQRR